MTWCKKALWAVPAAGVLCFVGYEAIAVARAKSRTPAILEGLASRPLKLGAVPQARLDMLLKVEDPGFYRHRGVDFSTPGQGRTTLTQALVKLLYFERFRPGFAKIEQSLIARFVLDPAMSKEDQLEVFLNRARFGSRGGRPVVGFADAARTYFGTDLASLSDDQFLALVAMLIAPREFDPVRRSDASAERVRRIRMLLSGRCRPDGVADVRYERCSARRL